MKRFLALSLLTLVATAASAQTRARDLGIPQNGTPGPLNAITDVAGVEVGMVTLIRGDGKMIVGQGPVRTGVTAILPRGKTSGIPVFAGWFTLNGNGEMTGTTWIDESGWLGGPVMITNTSSIGAVHHGTIEWTVKHHPDWDWSLPVVAETWDGGLNDISGQHVTPEHAMMAIDSGRRRRGTGGQRRWRHRHGLQRIQGRDRHLEPANQGRRKRLHRRRAGAVQLRPPVPPRGGRRAGGPGDSRSPPLQGAIGRRELQPPVAATPSPATRRARARKSTDRSSW